MMTELDIRMRYKRDTGFAPTTGRTGFPQGGSCNYKGDLTPEYIEWLENILPGRPQVTFQMEEHIAGAYRNNFYDEYDECHMRYTPQYSEWLEKKVIQTLN